MDAVHAQLPNTVGFSEAPTRQEVEWFVLGVIWHMMERGALMSESLPRVFIESAGKDTYRAFFLNRFLPNAGPRSRLPQLVMIGSHTGNFDNLGGASERNWWRRWFERALVGENRLASSDHVAAYEALFAIMIAHDLLERDDIERGPSVGPSPRGAARTHRRGADALRCLRPRTLHAHRAYRPNDRLAVPREPLRRAPDHRAARRGGLG